MATSGEPEASRTNAEPRSTGSTSHALETFLPPNDFQSTTTNPSKMKVWFEFPEATRFARTGRADILYTPIFFANQGIKAQLCLSEAWARAYNDLSALSVKVKLVGKASLGFLSIAGRPVSAMDTRYAMPSMGFRPIYTLTILDLQRRVRLEEGQNNKTTLSFSLPASTLDDLQQLASSLKIITADTHSSMEIFRETQPALIVSVQYSLVALIHDAEGTELSETEQEVRIFVSLAENQAPVFTAEMLAQNPMCQKVLTQMVPLGKSKSSVGARRRDSLPLIRRLSRTSSGPSSAQEDGYLIVEIEHVTPFTFRIKDDAAAAKVRMSVTYHGGSSADNDDDDDIPPPALTASIHSMIRSLTSLTLEPLLPEDREPDDQGNVRDDFFHLRAKVLPQRKLKLNFTDWKKVSLTPSATAQAQAHLDAETQKTQAKLKPTPPRRRTSLVDVIFGASAGAIADFSGSAYDERNTPVPTQNFRRTSQSLAPPRASNQSTGTTRANTNNGSASGLEPSGEVDLDTAGRVDAGARMTVSESVDAARNIVESPSTSNNTSAVINPPERRSLAQSITPASTAPVPASDRVIPVDSNIPAAQSTDPRTRSSNTPTSADPATLTDGNQTIRAQHSRSANPPATSNLSNGTSSRASNTSNPPLAISRTTTITSIPSNMSAQNPVLPTAPLVPVSTPAAPAPVKWRATSDLWLTHPVTSTLTPSFVTPYLSHLYSLHLTLSLAIASSPDMTTTNLKPSKAGSKPRSKSINLRRSGSLFSFSSSSAPMPGSSSKNPNVIELVTPVQVRYDLGLVPSYEVDSSLPEYDYSLPVYDDAVGLNPGTELRENSNEDADMGGRATHPSATSSSEQNQPASSRIPASNENVVTAAIPSRADTDITSIPNQLPSELQTSTSGSSHPPTYSANTSTSIADSALVDADSEARARGHAHAWRYARMPGSEAGTGGAANAQAGAAMGDNEGDDILDMLMRRTANTRIRAPTRRVYGEDEINEEPAAPSNPGQASAPASVSNTEARDGIPSNTSGTI